MIFFNAAPFLTLPLALPFLSVTDFPHRKLLLTETVHIMFYSQVENSATLNVSCSDFTNMLWLLLFCQSQHDSPSSSIQGPQLTTKQLREWYGLKVVFSGEAGKNTWDACLYANDVCMHSTKQTGFALDVHVLKLSPFNLAPECKCIRLKFLSRRCLQQPCPGRIWRHKNHQCCLWIK